MKESDAPGPDQQFGPAYMPDELRAVIGSEAWRTLAPNQFTPGYDLRPGGLSAEAVDVTVRALTEDPTINGPMRVYGGGIDMKTAASGAFREKALPGLGQLTYVGSGERKLCYALSTPNGERLAVLLAPGQQELGIHIPEDPRLTPVSKGPTRTVWEYSDARTYLSVPVGVHYTIRLQEFAGETGGMVPLPGAGLVARRAALKYLRNSPRDFLLDSDQSGLTELRHSRHLLRKPGHSRPSIIDIPVVERVA